MGKGVIMGYFYRPQPIGLKQDIQEHRAEEKKLKAKIDALEAVPNPDKFDQARLRTYKHFLLILLQSKAEVVCKIGRKK